MYPANNSSNASYANASSSASMTGRADIETHLPDATGYFARLETWAASEENGARATAVIKTWLAKGSSTAILDLSNLGLQSLPPLPQGLEKLLANHNQLSAVPENHLPASLKAIDLHNNRLTALPETLPVANLRLLIAANNKIQSLSGDALILHPDCEVYLRGNPLDESLLHKLYGPELDERGRRQHSSPPQGRRQAEAAPVAGTQMQMLADSLPMAELPEGFSIERLASSLTNIGAFCRFLNLIRDTASYQDAAFRKVLAQSLTQIASDPPLGALACELAEEIKPCDEAETLDRYQVAFVFHKIRIFLISRNIENGLYAGRVSDVALHLQQVFRTQTVESLASACISFTYGREKNWQHLAAGSVAAKVGPLMSLSFDMHHVNGDDELLIPDPLQIAHLPALLHAKEEEHFPNWFATHKSLPAYLLERADPQIAAIMNRVSDTHGNPLSGGALTTMHLQDLRAYFLANGIPDPTLVVPKQDHPPLFIPVNGTGRKVKILSNINEQIDCKTQ